MLLKNLQSSYEGALFTVKHKMKFSLKHEGMGVGKTIKPEVQIYIVSPPVKVYEEAS